MLFRLFRQFSPVLCAAFLLFGWGGSVIYAQLDARSAQNRNTQEARNASPENPAAMMMREMRTSLQKLPWNDLSPAAQAKVKSVVSGTPLFHRMPQQTVYADPEICHFLLRHPDLIIGFWEQLGATQLSLQEVRENHYILKEHSGTAAAVEVLHRTNDICIVYAKGEYRGPLLAKAHKGDVVLVLRTQFTRDETNEPMVVCDLDSFVQINSLGADVLAKLFFTSLVKIADSNFEVTVSFVSQVSKAAARNTAALKAAVEEIASIRQDVCAEFSEVVDRAAMRYSRRNQSAPLVIARQQPLPVGMANVHRQDFAISTKPPMDWEMDHFFDAPSPFSSSVYENTGELSAPKLLRTNAGEFGVPRLGLSLEREIPW